MGILPNDTAERSPQQAFRSPVFRRLLGLVPAVNMELATLIIETQKAETPLESGTQLTLKRLPLNRLPLQHLRVELMPDDFLFELQGRDQPIKCSLQPAP